MADIANPVEIVVEVPANLAGAYVYKIRELVGDEGSVQFSSYVDAPILTPGETLKIFREDAGYTQEELAGMLRKRGRKTTQVYVSQMESGTKVISKKMALDLAAIFGTGYKVFCIG